MGKVFLIIIILVAGFFGITAFFNNSQAPVQNNQLTLTPSSKARQEIKPTDQQPVVETPKQSLIPTTSWVTNSTSAKITTDKGIITLELYPQDAPKTVINFATLANSGYYNNLTFHRVEPGFVIQGGDPNGNGTGGYSIYGSTFEDELNTSASSYKLGYKEGVLAMANRGPNTNGSQFFIMLADNDSLPKNYTIFGKVTSGMDVVKKISVGDKMTSVTAK